MNSLIRPIAALPNRPALANSLQTATIPAIATVPGAMASLSVSMISVLRVCVGIHTIAGRGRASSPAPEGAYSVWRWPTCRRAIMPAPARLGRSTRKSAPIFRTPGSRTARPFAGQTAAAGTSVNNRLAAVLYHLGRSGRPGPIAAWPRAQRSIPLRLRVAGHKTTLGAGAGE